MSTAPQPSSRDHIFISYRRDDARGASGRIYDWLRIGFGRERVYRDVNSTGVGKWRDKIDAALARSAVCVAVIGPRWSDRENLPRLLDETDMVRHELVTSLGNSAITVVPTLVEGVKVRDLRNANLPPELRPLFDVWSVREVTEDGWEDDIRRLIAEIAAASGLSVGPDLDTLLRNAAAAQARAVALEQTSQLKSDQIEALRRTVNELRSKLAEASAVDRPGLARAFAELARGNSLAAEDAFEREYEAQSRVQEKAQQTRAEAARNVANLALLRDVSKAVAFYQKAQEAEPTHAETARLLGHALILIGDLRGAEAAFSESLRVAVHQENSWGEMAARLGLGDVFQKSKDLAAAAHAFMAALGLTEQRLAEDPENAQRQYDISLSHERIGNVLMAQGDAPGALAAYRKAFVIREALAARDVASTDWQRNLSVSHNKIGEVLEWQGDGPGALSAYRKALEIREALATRDPTNTQWQRDLSVSHNNIGDLLAAQGDWRGALSTYRKGLEIREALAARDPTNAQWQRDLSVSYCKIGELLESQGDGSSALSAYGKDFEIAQALAARDPANTLWQRDLSVSHNNIGDLLAAQGDTPGALVNYRKGLEIAEALAARDPTNTQWQRDLSVSHNSIGDSLAAQGDGPGALATYHKGMEIRQALAARDPTNAHWQCDLSVSHCKIGEVLDSQGDRVGALGAYRKGLEIREALAARDPLNAQWQIDVAVSCAKLGALDHGQSTEARRNYLVRGRGILQKLQASGRLGKTSDRVDWFDGQLTDLDSANHEQATSRPAPARPG
jgi:tetratricopeptide (TPR) repeat protein